MRPQRLLAAAAAAAAAAAFALSAHAVAHPAPGTSVVHAIDVGTGLSIFVEGADFTLLYDAGSQDNSAGGRDNRVLTYLRHVRPEMTKLDHLILSHPHEDHVQMMDEVLAAYDVDHVWDSGSFNPTCGYMTFVKAVAEEPGVVYRTAGGQAARAETFGTCGDQTIPASVPISFGDTEFLGRRATMRVLHADNLRRGSDLNNGSLVVRLDLGGKGLLLVGDAEAGGRTSPSVQPGPRSAEGILLDRFPEALRSDILVVGHHGSSTSSRTSFLDAVGANHYVISSGPTKYHGLTLPDREIETALRNRRDRRTLWKTYLNDAACARGRPKIGLDDRSPGGCHNVRIVIQAGGAIVGRYFRATDACSQRQAPCRQRSRR